jgi:hypothetical protein
MIKFIRKIFCRVLGHKLRHYVNLVAFDHGNPQKSYRLGCCERCNVQILDGVPNDKSVTVMNMKTWGDYVGNLHTEQIDADVAKMNRLLVRITKGTSGKYRSIDDPWGGG